MMHKIHTADLTTAQKRELWLQVIADYEQSHSTPREFCQQQHIKLETFYYRYSSYKRRLHKKKVQPKEITFIPMVSEHKENKNCFCLTTPHGFELHISPSFDANCLLQVLNALSHASC